MVIVLHLPLHRQKKEKERKKMLIKKETRRGKQLSHDKGLCHVTGDKKELMKALETQEDKRACRIQKKEDKERRKRAKMGLDEEMMVSVMFLLCC